MNKTPQRAFEFKVKSSKLKVMEEFNFNRTNGVITIKPTINENNERKIGSRWRCFLAKRIKTTQTKVPKKTKIFPSILLKISSPFSKNGWLMVKSVPAIARPMPIFSVLVTVSFKKRAPPIKIKNGAVIEIREASIAVVF